MIEHRLQIHFMMLKIKMMSSLHVSNYVFLMAIVAVIHLKIFLL